MRVDCQLLAFCAGQGWEDAHPWLAERPERLAAPLRRHVDAVDAVQRNAGPLVVVRVPRADPGPHSTGHGGGLTPVVRLEQTMESAFSKCDSYSC